MVYFMKLQYFATGEGARSYYVLATIDSKEALYDKCLEAGIDNYFMQCAEFFHLDEITDADLKFMETTIPKMYTVIKSKLYKKGYIWIKYEDYLNFS